MSSKEYFLKLLLHCEFLDWTVKSYVRNDKITSSISDLLYFLMVGWSQPAAKYPDSCLLTLSHPLQREKKRGRTKMVQFMGQDKALLIGEGGGSTTNYYSRHTQSQTNAQTASKQWEPWKLTPFFLLHLYFCCREWYYVLWNSPLAGLGRLSWQGPLPVTCPVPTYLVELACILRWCKRCSGITSVLSTQL